VSRHNYKKNEAARGQNKIHIIEDTSSRRPQRARRQGGRGALADDSLSLIDTDPGSLRERYTVQDEVFQLLHRTSRRKDDIISSLICQNSELLHHIRFLEDLFNSRTPPTPCADSRVLAVIKPLPPVEKDDRDACQQLQKQMAELKQEQEKEVLALKTELQMRSQELEKAREKAGSRGEGTPGPGVTPEQFQELREKLNKEAEAKMRVIQEFMELSESFGEKEEAFKREMEKRRLEVEEKEIKVSLIEQHLDDVKAAKLKLKEECEKLRQELKEERDTSLWLKVMRKIFPTRRNLP